ncbi:MAG: methionine adenosyltransferase, partial [Cyclobacteriaceae bacterium]|nr:methionine adenosyltransferase [Cyclobacteriaceae bacterium]
MSYLFTSESVSEGHPDKVCDAISDGVLDAIFEQDPNARVACETFVTTGLVVVGGEVTTKAYVDIEKVVRQTIKNIGYTKAEYKFDSESCGVLNAIHSQSPDIAMGVDTGGAGDQGIMFGYACRETDVLMPAAIHYSHAILEALAQARKSGHLKGKIEPDSKSQITLKYKNDKPVCATSIVVSTQHSDSLTQNDVKELIRPYVEKIIPDGWMPPEEEFYVNPTGRFVIGGPVGDSGLTGRKIIVDTYGG